MHHYIMRIVALFGLVLSLLPLGAKEKDPEKEGKPAPAAVVDSRLGASLRFDWFDAAASASAYDPQARAHTPRLELWGDSGSKLPLDPEPAVFTLVPDLAWQLSAGFSTLSPAGSEPYLVLAEIRARAQGGIALRLEPAAGFRFDLGPCLGLEVLDLSAADWDLTPISADPAAFWFRTLFLGGARAGLDWEASPYFKAELDYRLWGFWDLEQLPGVTPISGSRWSLSGGLHWDWFRQKPSRIGMLVDGELGYDSGIILPRLEQRYRLALHWEEKDRFDLELLPLCWRLEAEDAGADFAQAAFRREQWSSRLGITVMGKAGQWELSLELPWAASQAAEPVAAESLRTWRLSLAWELGL